VIVKKEPFVFKIAKKKGDAFEITLFFHENYKEGPCTIFFDSSEKTQLYKLVFDPASLKWEPAKPLY